MSDNPITEQLKKVASDVLTEETLQAIEVAFNESVDTKAEELATLRVEKALVEQDEEHAVKLEKLLEAIDADHTAKLERIVEAIDKNHAHKLVALVERFKGEVDTDANMFKENLVDNISNYLDLYVEKHIPTEDIQEAVKNKHAASVLENLRKTLSIDAALSTDHVRDAVIDGKRQIDEAQHIARALYEENEKLKSTNSDNEANLALDRLTEGLPATKKRHITRVFAGKDVGFINENFQYALDMFEKTEAEKVETLKEQVTTKKRPADRPVGQKGQVVTESVEQQIAQTEPRNLQDSNLFNNYMGELGKW